MAVKVMRCKCKHEEQDKLHGKGNRVFNSLSNVKSQKQHARCTVCGAIK